MNNSCRLYYAELMTGAQVAYGMAEILVCGTALKFNQNAIQEARHSR